MSNSHPKAQAEFHVAKGDANFGPWTIEEIAERIVRSELSVTDFVFDEARQDWITLLECEALKSHLHKSQDSHKAKPKAPPPTVKKVDSELRPAPSRAPVETRAPEAPAVAMAVAIEESEEWFVQKGANRYGPMTYLGLVRALQEKSVYDFDFVWKEGMPAWMRLAEHPDFHPDRIRQLADKLAAAQTVDNGVFFRREHPRVRFDSEVIVHDDQSVWMGQAFEASAGGSGLVIENATLNPGQVVRLHFAPCDGLPAFNALGEIVGKRYTKEIRGSKSPVRYAVRFLKLDGAAEPQVREYFEAAKAS